jgi:lipid-A-disaccharide synthase
MVAGEASGDLLGGQLIRALRELMPELHFAGIGGPRMEAAGMEIWFPLEQTAVRGVHRGDRAFCEIVGIRRQRRRRFSASPPAVFIGIDAPDFNSISS